MKSMLVLFTLVLSSSLQAGALEEELEVSESKFETIFKVYEQGTLPTPKDLAQAWIGRSYGHFWENQTVGTAAYCELGDIDGPLFEEPIMGCRVALGAKPWTFDKLTNAEIKQRYRDSALRVVVSFHRSEACYENFAQELPHHDRGTVCFRKSGKYLVFKVMEPQNRSVHRVGYFYRTVH